MLRQDEIEKFEMLRDIAEHNAMFQNAEGVRQVRDARENAIDIPDEDFKDTVKELFGRDLEFEENKNVQHIENPLDIYKDFDEVEFIPFGGDD